MLLAEGAVRAGYVRVDGLTIDRADVRGPVERPHGFGVEALRGAFKLASELQRRSTGRTIYVLDQPTTSLHFDPPSFMALLFPGAGRAAAACFARGDPGPTGARGLPAARCRPAAFDVDLRQYLMASLRGITCHPAQPDCRA